MVSKYVLIKSRADGYYLPDSYTTVTIFDNYTDAHKQAIDELKHRFEYLTDKKFYDMIKYRKDMEVTYYIDDECITERMENEDESINMRISANKLELNHNGADNSNRYDMWRWQIVDITDTNDTSKRKIVKK